MCTSLKIEAELKKLLLVCQPAGFNSIITFRTMQGPRRKLLTPEVSKLYNVGRQQNSSLVATQSYIRHWEGKRHT